MVSIIISCADTQRREHVLQPGLPQLEANVEFGAVIRKTIFWAHLVTGVAVGLVVLMMSVTGMLLTYERQMLAWANGSVDTAADASARQSVEALVASIALQEPGFEPTAVTISADPAAPVLLTAGRSGTRYVNPYTAEALGAGPERLERFFGVVEGWHRWFNAGGESRALWRNVTGVSNLGFLFLVVSGAYLWLPRVYRRAAFKARFLFNPKAGTGRARDYNWHHVFGIWTAVPLVVVVASAVVFSYSWANDLVYRSFGEAPPQRGLPGPPPAAGARSADAAAADAGDSQPGLPIDDLLERAIARSADWRSITVQLPRAGDDRVRLTLDEGDGGQPQLRHALTLDPRTGAELAWEPFSSQSAGRRARSWVRFLHTGEALGIVGQTIAGVVSLTTILMVWTGLALAYRRLIVPLIKRTGR
jgi:uncharacterized iron-regulated membrane protein